MENSNKTGTIDKFQNNKTEFIIALLIALTILFVYFQIRHHDFVVYDDLVYVTDNHYVLDGLSFKGLKWAFDFTDKNKTYWHPLTWISHMVDIQLFGLNAGKHLLINIILHILNSLLLFHLFNRMTGNLWPSALVAGLFALHPLNVESVAWVAARKNLLSTTFWMLTTLAYVRYTEAPSLRHYFTILLIFSLGLLSKPMLVTLPCTLLLLDIWPLRRSRILNENLANRLTIPLKHLIIEKIPMLVLSVISIYISTFSLSNYGDLVAVESVGMPLRVANAIVSYIVYLYKMILPVNLTCYYPFPSHVSLWKVIVALVLLAGMTTWAISSFRKQPFILIGWLWYLGTLFPVIGLVQAGLWPSIADRFVYIPLIGIFVTIAWSMERGLKGSIRYRGLLLTFTAIGLSVLAFLSHKQASYWENSITLFNRSISVTKNNYLSHYALGYAFEQKGAVEDAIHHYQEALKINPNEIDAHYNLAVLLAREGQTDGAIRHYNNVLRLEPDDAQAYNNLGNIFFRQEDWEKAIKHYRDAIAINPKYAKAHRNLGATMFRKGKITEAVSHFREALRIRPEDEQTRYYLQMALSKQENIAKSSAETSGP